jgi:GT2 family glycosyltransferase
MSKEKEYYDIVFVVLTYRNTKDLEDFFKFNKIYQSHTIVVNSFFDELSEKTFKEISIINGADFLSVPNRGYGAGNNAGCKYALDNYTFKYLIISNADVMIDTFKVEDIKPYNNSIVAPKIINLSGKNQNPSVPFIPSLITEKFRYWIYTGNHNRILWVYFALSRFKKILFYAISLFRRKIFSAHGAFLIVPEDVLKKLYPLYNEDMFLFNEEEHLGRYAKQKGIDTYYVPEIIIRHKEDGSMSVANINEFEKLKQSYLVYYKYWISK